MSLCGLPWKNYVLKYPKRESISSLNSNNKKVVPRDHLINFTEQFEQFELNTREKAKAAIQASIQKLEGENKLKEDEAHQRLVETQKEISLHKQKVCDLSQELEEKEQKLQQLTKTVQILIASVKKQVCVLGLLSLPPRGQNKAVSKKKPNSPSTYYVRKINQYSSCFLFFFLSLSQACCRHVCGSSERS